MPHVSQSSDPHLGRGNERLSQGKWREAIDAYNQAVQVRDMWGAQHDALFPYETSFHEVLLKRSIARAQLQHHAESKADLDEVVKYCTAWTVIIKLQLTIDQNHQQILAALFNTLGNAYARVGQLDRAIASHNESIQTVKSIITSPTLHKSILTTLNNLLVDSLNNLGNVHHARGELDAEIACRTESLERMQAAHKGAPHIDIASALNNLGNAHQAKGEHDRAIAYHIQSLETMRNAAPHHVTASVLNNLGNDYQVKGERDRAIECYTESLMIMKAIPYYPHQYLTLITNNLGNAYHAKGEWNKEIECRVEALERMQAAHKGAPHIDIASALNNLGNAHQAKGEYDRAIAYHIQSLETMRHITTEPHPMTAGALNNLGNAYQSKGECDLAIDYHTKSLAMTQAIHDREPNPLTAISLNNLGNAHQTKGEWDEASKYYTESLQVQKTIHHAPLCLVLASSFSNLGNAYQARGEYDKAINCHSKHLETTKIIHGREPNLLTAIALNNLGSSHFMKGAFTQAMEYQDASLKMMQQVHAPPQFIILVSTNLGNDYCALERYDDAIALNPRSVSYHYAKYKFLSNEHSADEATTCLEQAVKLSSIEDLIQHWADGDRDYVVEKLEQLLTLFPPTQNMPCEQRDNPFSNLSFTDVKQATPVQISSDGSYVFDDAASQPSTTIGMVYAQSDASDVLDGFTEKGKAADIRRLREFFQEIDKYGNSKLSEALERKGYKEIKEAFFLQDMSDVDLLKYFAQKMNEREYRDVMSVSRKVAANISIEATDQLDLLGESIYDIVAAYDVL